MSQVIHQEANSHPNVSNGTPRNWPGLVAAGALFLVGWMLVHAYGDIPQQSVFTHTENNRTDANLGSSASNAQPENTWISIQP